MAFLTPRTWWEAWHPHPGRVHGQQRVWVVQRLTHTEPAPLPTHPCVSVPIVEQGPWVASPAAGILVPAHIGGHAYSQR